MMTAQNDLEPVRACGRPPQATVLDLVSGYWKTQVTYALTRLGIADAIGDGALPLRALSAQIGAPTDALGRLLRAGAGLGLLRTDASGHYALTDTGRCLRRDVPQSVRHLVLL